MEGTRLNGNLYKSKAENAEKSSNHEFWRKMFCLVAITYTSPKVSVTARKRFLEKKRDEPGVSNFHKKLVCKKLVLGLYAQIAKKPSVLKRQRLRNF